MEFDGFRVTNYRNIIDFGWIDANRITAFVGQNESGKSNLFEALYTLNPIIPGAEYSLDEDWPVDQWEGRKDATGKWFVRPSSSSRPRRSRTSPTPL